MPKPKRLPNGRWGCRVDGPPHSDGTRNQIRVAEDTLEKARTKVHEIEGMRLDCSKATTRSPTLGEFGDRWLDDHLPNLAPKTAVNDRSRFNKHITSDPIANTRLGDLTAQDGREWLARMRQKPGRGGKTLSPRSVRHCLALLNQILKAAVTWGEIRANPLADVEGPRIRKDPTKIKCWERSEFQAFCREMAKSKAPNTEMWFAAADLTVFTGLRRGELAGLLWRDVDFENRQLVVRRNRIDPGLETSEPKSTASNRTIPLSRRTLDDLASLKRIQEADRAVLGTGWTGTGFVLVLPDGMPPNPDSITRRFKRDCERAGVRYITWHGLRHTYATFSLAAGVQIHDVSRILGHSSIAITLAEYAWTLPGATVEAMESLADYILGDDKKQPDRVVL